MCVAVRVIPCLDVDAGRVVKGVNFRELRDAGDPVEMARRVGGGQAAMTGASREHGACGSRHHPPAPITATLP